MLGDLIASAAGAILTSSGDGREIVELRPWSALRVPAVSARSFEAGPEGLELLAFGTHTDGDRGELVEPGWPG